MVFAATGPTKRQIYGSLWELTYKFTGEALVVGGTVDTPLTVVDVRAWGNKNDGTANILGISVGKTATAGQVRIAYTDPNADHTGYVVVRGTL